LNRGHTAPSLDLRQNRFERGTGAGDGVPVEYGVVPDRLDPGDFQDPTDQLFHTFAGSLVIAT
jgi:hypothetical protein